MISEKSFLSGYLHLDRNLHSKFHVSSSSSLGSAMIVSQSISQFLLLYMYRLAGSPCFATVNLCLLRKVKALNFSLLLIYYVNSGKLLNYVYIDICPRRRLSPMCAFKKKAKTPCRIRGIPSNKHQVIKPMDYN